MIRDLTHPGLPLTFDASKPEGPSLPALPMHSALQDFPWTPLREGLQKTIDWYRKNVYDPAHA